MSSAAQQTLKNLGEGLAFESVAHRKYNYFAKLARELGDGEVAELFESIAQEESAHAMAHLSVLYPAGSLTVVELLQLGAALEADETGRRYPEFAATARAELASATRPDEKGLLMNAERRFEALAEKESAHAQRLGAMLARRRAAAAQPAR